MQRLPEFIPPELKLPKKYTMWRPDQAETVDDIVRSSQEVYLLDAPTGSGKSLVGVAAYKRLTPMDKVIDRMRDEEEEYRCIYLTQTIQLQQQVLGDFPEGKMVKGRSNYPCATIPELKASECPQQYKKYGEHCEDCQYLQDKHAALISPLAVLNNAYYLTEVNGPHGFAGANMVILDEIDSLESSLMERIEFSVSEAQCKKYHLEPPENMESLNEWQKWAESSRRAVQWWIEGKGSQIVFTEVEQWSDVEININRDVKQAESFVSKMALFVNEVTDDWILDITEKPRAGWVVTFKPVTVAPYVTHYLWRHGKRFLGMSGTILDPQILADDLGIVNYSYRRMDSQFPVDNRLIHYRPVANLKYAKMDTELPKLLAEVDNIIQAYPGKNILVHTVSYKIRDFLVDMLPAGGVDPARIITHNSENRAEKLTQFKNSRGLIMISPSFDRGVDLPGDECRVVIICKVPYLALGDKQVKARLAMDRGQQWYNLRAIQTILQMSGRAVRSDNDFATTYILDRQFNSLLARTRHLLPKWWLDAIREGM